MDLNKMSIEELKVMAFDLTQDLQTRQANLQVIHQVIAEKTKAVKNALQKETPKK